MSLRTNKFNSIISKLEWEFNKLPANSTVTFLNPYSYLLLRKNDKIDNIDFIGIDGGLLKSIINFFFKSKIQRISFDNTSLAPKVYNYCIKNNKSIYFIGSTNPHINEFIKIVEKDKPELNILGFRSGYFSDEEDRNNTINEIIKCSPDFVVAGMGTPNQEHFILDLRKKGYNGISFTCGGYFHQTKNGVNYYPKLYNKYNLRWVYRIIDEPKLFKRYFLIYPQAMLYLFLDLFSHKLKKIRQKY